MIKRIAHIGIATESLAVVSEFYKDLGLTIDSTEKNRDYDIKIAQLKVGESAIELMEPTASDSPVQSFLEKRGPGIHHIALEVEDLDRELERLKSKNVHLIDETPRVQSDGRRIAFIHPDSTGGVLIELMELEEAD